MNEFSAKIVSANEAVFSSGIEGWVGDRIYQIVDFANDYHERMRVTGDIAEIGIHHGKLFFILSAAAKEEDRCIAIDVFERQELNLDQSGSGSQQVFEGNLDRLFPELRQACDILAMDSMAIPASMARQVLSQRGLRLMSIDGGHTIQHVVNDLSIAQEVVNPGAVILLDDFFGPHWPSVTEGFFTYMGRFNKRLAPFLVFQNKLFLTTYSEHASILSGIRAYIERTAGDEIHHKWKYTTICGFQVLGCS